MRCRVVSCCPNSETPGGLAGWNDDRKGPFCVYLLAAILGDLRNTGLNPETEGVQSEWTFQARTPLRRP